MEKNNPNRKFRETHKINESATVMQRGSIKGLALVLRHPFNVLISAALGKRIKLSDLTYEQAERVIEYSDGHVKRRSGGG